jgi:signal transduction histidine kinase
MSAGPIWSSLTTGTAGGLALLLAGLWAWWRGRPAAASHALLAACAAAGVALLTRFDGVAPAWLAAVRELALAMLPAALWHLALTFPIDRLRGRRSAVLLLLYLPCLALALVSLLGAADPSMHEILRGLGAAASAAGGIALAAVLAAGALRAPAALLRRRCLLALLGAFGAGLPALVQLLRTGPGAGAALLDAAVPTAFLFPLALGAAIAAPGLIGIDDVLRRVVSGVLIGATVAITYVATWLAVAALSPGTASIAASPIGAAFVNLAIIFLVAAIRDGARVLSDRWLAPTAYDGEAHLAALSRGLASARTLETVVAHARDVLAAALRPSWVMIYAPDGAQRFRPVGGAGRRAVTVPPALLERIARGDPVLLDGGEHLDGALPAPWDALDTALLVPLRASREVVGLLALGRRASRRPYTPHDLGFLRTAAYQIALGLLGSTAFDQLEGLNQRLGQLNARLEEQVAERTAAVEQKNAELNCSLAELKGAYRQLERHHAGLLRAERLATLGRLTAGLAHEINTPLSAVMNALKIIGDLGREYAAAIDDPDVSPDDHREIARELLTAAQSAAEWTSKAAASIRGVQSHGREARAGTAQPFAVRDVADDVRGLVAHRLRAAACQLEFAEDPPGLSLVGDRGQLGQVLVNLITNAVDAYEDRGIANGRIAVHAARSAGGGVRLHVTDWAGGIPPAVLPHIFEELYTTKSAGRGTGLGLWIARALVEQGFGGTLDVLTSNGSSTFVADFPAAASPDRSADPPPAPAAAALPTLAPAAAATS